MLRESFSLYYRFRRHDLGCFLVICLFVAAAPFLDCNTPAYQKFFISSLLYGSLLTLTFSKKRSSILSLQSTPRILKVYTMLFSLLVVLVFFQLLPLPRSLLSLLHSNSFEVYKTAGLAWYSTSIEPLQTLLGLWWLVTIGTLTWIVARVPVLPRFKVIPRSKSAQLKKKIKTHRNHKDEGDLTSDIIKWIIVLVSVPVSIWTAFDWELQVKSATARHISFHQVRADWPLENANHLALLLNIAIMQLFMIFNVEQERYKQNSRYKGLGRQVVEFLSRPSGFLVLVISTIALVSMTRGIYLTKSKSGVVALQICLLYLGYVCLAAFRVRSDFFASFFVRHKNLRRVKRSVQPAVGWFFTYAHRLGFIFFTITAPLIFLLYSELDSSYLPKRASDITSYYIPISRLKLWDASRLMIQDHLLMGVGFGCWKLIVPQYASAVFAKYTFNYAHNDYIQMFAEVGIVGCAWVGCAVGYLVWTTGRLLFRSRFSALTIEFLGSYLTIITVLMFALIDFPFHSPGITILFAIICADFIRIHKRLSQQNLSFKPGNNLGSDIQALAQFWNKHIKRKVDSTDT